MAHGNISSTHSKVKRNEFGGVLITEDEIEAAFKFLDMGQTGKITIATLKKRFGTFFDNIPAHRIKALLGDRHEITLTALKELVVDNSVKTFDPVAEAFKVSAGFRRRFFF